MLHTARHGKRHLHCPQLMAWHEDWQVRLEVLQLGRAVVSKQTSMRTACKCLPARRRRLQRSMARQKSSSGVQTAMLTNSETGNLYVNVMRVCTVCKCNNESQCNSECRHCRVYLICDERDAAKARLKRRMRRMDESSLGTAGYNEHGL